MSDRSRDSPAAARIEAAALIPNFNHGRTLADVLERTLAVLPRVLVVDDGSTDDSWRAIASFGGRVRSLRHPSNLGKGRALRDGLRLLAADGFTHAIALDSDGQHFPEDIPRLLEASSLAPEALAVGERDMRAAPWRSRFGLFFSNACLRVLAGARLRDSQCGFRSYPLRAISELELFGDRYEFELEVLLKAAWAGVPIRAVPIRVTYEPPGGRISHFRPARDFLRVALSVARCLRSRPRRKGRP
ncbi:MAG: glycosyltransferase family 2 protein [Planctomycetota bacterium]